MATSQKQKGKEKKSHVVLHTLNREVYGIMISVLELHFKLIFWLVASRIIEDKHG